MADNTESAATQVDASAGHLSVHIPGAHPEEIRFLFEQRPQRLGYSFAASLLLQAAVVGLFVLLSRLAPPTATALLVLPEPLSDQIVWLSEPGPGGGGGGGGNKMPDPPRKAELPGKEKISIPIEKPPQIQPPKQEPKEEPKPIEELTIPALQQASAAETLTGVIDNTKSTPLETFSQGAGAGGGGGTGTGTGSGPGTGSGLGPGVGGGVGGGTYRPGNGVTTPVPVNEVKPQYTSEAMRARIQGTVWVECIVQPNGICTEVHVVRSLDPNFGLDREAVKAAQQWRFRPGTRLGQAVPVLVTIELSFALR